VPALHVVCLFASTELWMQSKAFACANVLRFRVDGSPFVASTHDSCPSVIDPASHSLVMNYGQQQIVTCRSYECQLSITRSIMTEGYVVERNQFSVTDPNHYSKHVLAIFRAFNPHPSLYASIEFLLYRLLWRARYFVFGADD
jgi:hypothetical protein